MRLLSPLTRKNEILPLIQAGADAFYAGVAAPVLFDEQAIREGKVAALTVAGGLSETADPSGLKIVRQLPRGGEELIEVDLKKIAAGKVPDVRIRPADLVVVPSTPQRRAWADVRRFFERLLSVGVDARYDVLD